MSGTKSFALIPARGGSKRIPKKNIKPFHGKPIIAYSIETALNCGLFDEVIVSTDCEQIGELALQYGASVPFLRPADIAGDHATTGAVIAHAVQFMQDKNPEYSHCCCIYPTAPFLQAKYLKQGHDALLSDPSKMFAFSVTEYRFPIQRALSIENGEIAPVSPEFSSTRSQDLPARYHDAGQFYWGTLAGFLSGEAMFSKQASPVILPSYLVQDIDTPDDWKRAELMFSKL
ncbi:pseudaminic acid cytidylyltransferase [Glaciecola siphonariae]|uniref:Pseudaminic acid cytidylyltransferase n=1 Tax=Glaciecola siphonariae TaxID=521012 RepID=A0ABV9LUW2_9ALTE